MYIRYTSLHPVLGPPLQERHQQLEWIQWRMTGTVMGWVPWPGRRGCGAKSVPAGRRGNLWASLAPTGWMESCSLHSNVRVESKRHKLKHKRLSLEIRKNLFPMRMVQHWGPGSFGCPQPGRFEAQAGWNLEQPGLTQYLNTLWIGVSSSLQSDLSSTGCALTWCFTFYGMFYIFFIVGGDSIWLELYSS